mmetsp:Transcript_5967/g.9890  ORF Transcript_5967/g.9890 Transcript_5967/m.9890 type:complete len:241 (+) Transcript_5967:110-832(+)
MGACASGDYSYKGSDAERDRDRQLQRELNRYNQHQEEIHKLLLLGAGQSGKSTMFKQMMILYGDGFSEAERKSYEPIIYGNIIQSMQVLLEQADLWAQTDSKCEVSNKLSEEMDEIGNLRLDEPLDEKYAGMVWNLWKDPAIQAVYERRNEFQLNESAAYYFENVKRIGGEDYVPSEEDLLRSRARTTGVIENNFTIDGNRFQMFDVGGQRSERKKWIHCFENVSCVLFVAAISAYNQVI